MSYAIYIGKNHSTTRYAWLGGYGDEPSSHWLENIPAADHAKGEALTVGVGPNADMLEVHSDVPQVAQTFSPIRVSYSSYLGVPAPIANGRLNEHGVAVRDVWSTSPAELIAMTPKDQQGLNYRDFVRIVMKCTTSARHLVELVAELIAVAGESHRIVDMRKDLAQGADVVSQAAQAVEATRTAVFECKRLMYLMHILGVETLDRIIAAFEAREAGLADRVAQAMGLAGKLAQEDGKDASAVLGYLSQLELQAGLDMVVALSGGLEAELRAYGDIASTEPVSFEQI